MTRAETGNYCLFFWPNNGQFLKVTICKLKHQSLNITIVDIEQIVEI